MTAGNGPMEERSGRGVRPVDFLRDTRGGAVGLACVFIAMMCLAGTALISDHAVVVRQRDTLQAAAAAASIAVTQQLARRDPALTQEELIQELRPMAIRYILANLPEGSRELAADTLEVTITPDREAGVVGVAASADLGGAIVGRYLWGRLVSRTHAGSGAERVLSPVDLVLAIDVTGSMGSSIVFGDRNPPSNRRRINVVRAAAQALVSALYDQQGATMHVSVGLVPFNTTVNIGAERRDWVSDLGRGHKVIPAGFGPWSGCVEHRTDDLDLSLATPADEPFTSWFWPSSLEYHPADRAALAAQTASGTVRGDNDWSAGDPHTDYKRSPHQGCPRDAIIPLTDDRDTIEGAIASLRPWSGGGTMTHVGVVWGRRLLASEWRDAWALPEVPEELDRKRVLVVLTDGRNDAIDDKNTYPGDYRRDGVHRRERDYYNSHYTGYGRVGPGRIEEGHRVDTRLSGTTNEREEFQVLDDAFRQSCELAKSEGVIVFTVSAVPQGHPQEQELGALLRACATSEDHAFVQNSEPARMQEAFREIGRMVQGVRRTAMAGSG